MYENTCFELGSHFDDEIGTPTRPTKLFSTRCPFGPQDAPPRLDVVVEATGLEGGIGLAMLLNKISSETKAMVKGKRKVSWTSCT